MAKTDHGHCPTCGGEGYESCGTTAYMHQFTCNGPESDSASWSVAELRACVADVIRAHRLENARCVACGEHATFQSLHQADALLRLFDVSVRGYIGKGANE